MMKRFRERFDRKKTPHVKAKMCPSDFGDAPHMNETAPVLPDTSFPGYSTGNFDSVQFETGKGEQAHFPESSPVLDYTEFAMGGKDTLVNIRGDRND
jgi:hypothetical protein